MRIAVVTPYAGEGEAVLRRCCASVRAQTLPCTHVLVADGTPSPEAARWTDQHIVLPAPHRDNGNTARGVGAISAWNRGFDAVAFLDADNWYAPGHLAGLAALCRHHDLALAFSERHIVLDDGTVLEAADPEDAARAHVDTSCMFFTAAAAFLTPHWAMMDPALSPVCDRVMLALVRASGLRHGWSGERTVFFRSMYSLHYRMAGRPPPAGAHDVDWAALVGSTSPRRSLDRLGFALRIEP